MTMATLQLYKNPHFYPDYGGITKYGNSKPCTPVGMGLKTGKIRVEGTQSDFMSCNYLSIRRDGKTIYAWIDDVTYLNDRTYEVHYSVDAWRTFRSKINLGVQFLERHPLETDAPDELLGATRKYPITKSTTFAHSTDRVLIVQTRIVDGARKGLSSTPVQPSPYAFWAVRYNPENWQTNNAITGLLAVLNEVAQTNVVTMYSIPYMDLSTNKTVKMDLPVVAGGDTHNIEGWQLIPNQPNIHELLTRKIPIPKSFYEDEENLLRVNHSVKVVVPEAGILDIPDQLLKKGQLYIKQNIDIFSGASNYMIVDSSNNNYGQSVRGNSVSSIPILSDAMETYLSQNQSALTTSLIGDVAMTGVGIGTTVLTGGVGGLVGGGTMALGGINNIMNKRAGIDDMKNMNNVGNPPAFLGTALTGEYNGVFWIVITRDRVGNADIVHNNFGYPVNRIHTITFPNKGYIKTQGCNVSSDGTVPRWAIQEINGLFDNGILVH